MKVTRTCRACGVEFQIERWRLKEPTRGTYCSQACSGPVNVILARRAKVDNGFTPWNKVDGATIECRTCGVAFRVEPYRAETARFCSRACSHAAKRLVTGTAHPLFTRIERRCETCGKAVMVKPAKLQEFRFCSRSCHGAHLAAHCPKISSLEVVIASALQSRGIASTPQFAVGPYTIDFAFPDARLAVEVDGAYWHGTPIQSAKDKRRDSYLRRHGWTVLRIPEADVKLSPSKCVDRIARALEASS